MNWIVFEITTGFILSYSKTEPTLNTGEDKVQVVATYLSLQDLRDWKWDGTNVIKCTEEESEDRRRGDDPLIYDVVSDEVKKKDFRSINYIAELLSGVKLHSVQEFTDDGFVLSTKWYKDYINSTSKGILFLVVDESYVTNSSQSGLHPSQREVESRAKTRKWNNSKTDSTKFNSKEKVTDKKYDTRSKKSKEGERRRNNIISMLTENVGTGGILSGVFTDPENANNELTNLLETYNGAFSTYIKTGRGTIYSDIENDSSISWLDSTVLDTAQTQFMCPWMVGMTLKLYIVEKLKGNIK